MAQGPCTVWASALDVCAPCNAYDVDQGLLADALDVASELLWAASGRVFGVCDYTVRPVTGCGCGGGSSLTRHASWCHGRTTVTLDAYPVRDVTEVKVDGLVLDGGLYRVDDWRYLRRLPDVDGGRPGWPSGNDLALDDSEPGTWSVTFTTGRDIPAAGRIAAAALACQIVLACDGDESCVLPQNFSSITRQGISILAPNPEQVIRRVAEVASFLDAWNPAGLSRPPAVVSPDLHARTVTVGTS